jgi:sortase (surface protein transpeptidase)
MTLLSNRAQPTQDTNPVSESAPAEWRKRPFRLPQFRSPRRILVLTSLGLVSLLVLYLFFNAFVTELWYQSRQRSMAAVGGSALAPKPGQPVGVLQVKQPFTLNVEIAEGDGPAELRAGPGHRPGTPLPGYLGNSVIYGRASEWGGPFGNLHRADPGTEIYVQTRLGSTGPIVDYKVESVHVVSAAASVRYLGPSDDYRLTLVTDAGGRFSDERVVVIAVSGTHETLSPPPAHLSPGPSTPSFFNLTLVEFGAWLIAAAGVFLLLRRRHSLAVVAGAVTPVVLAALVSGFLELYLLWSPLA